MATWKLLTTLVLVATPLVGWAQLKGETLLVTVPAGYKIDYENRRGNLLLSEMVPQAESVKSWTEMVTTQIFFGAKDMTPDGFEARMKASWVRACPGGAHASFASGTENGYPFAAWLLACPRNPATGAPENTWFKAIQGNDSFYVVQKAFKFEPTKEHVAEWTQFLRRVQVCDTRLPDRACPPLEKSR